MRSAIGLEPGTVVEVGLRDGAVSIEPAPARVRIVRHGRLHVAEAEGELQSLPEEQVRAVREQLRRRR
ncbi:MAG TPA: hypothetical protein VFB20_03365 [Burkholderiales bacterium]|nr:hypothetical protein [Burkholderiales bacterium]